MKKTTFFTIGASLLLAVPNIVQADAGFKSGFKVGLGAGYKNHRVKSKAEYDASAVARIGGQNSESVKKAGTDNTANFEAQVGYDFIKDHLLAAVELNYRYSPVRNQIAINNSQPILEPGEVPFAIKRSQTHDFGLNFNLGRVIRQNLALYVIGNVRLGRFEHKFENNKPNLSGLERNIKSAQYRWGLGGGLGCRYALSDGLSLGVEATYDVYQKVKTKSTPVITGGVNFGNFSTTSYQPRIINVLFKVSKTF